MLVSRRQQQADGEIDTALLITSAAVPPNPDSLTALSVGLMKPVQVFRVQTGQDTLLRGLEGTTVWIPANALVQDKKVLNSRVVEVRLREFYTLADILLQQLSTTSGSALLETGGMVQLTATANGRPCVLKRGAGVEVGFPTNQPKEGMELFNGVSVPGRGLDWKPAVARRSWQLRPRAFRAPAYPRGNGGMRRWLRNKVVYTAAMAQHLNEMRRTRRLRRLLRHIGRNERATIVAIVEADFELDAQGQLAKVRITNAEQNDSLLSKTVVQALQKMPRWRPATNGRNQTIRSQMHVQVLFTANRRVMVEYLKWDAIATHRMCNYDQMTVAARNSQPMGGMETAMYAFPVNQLGWMNCDRFINSPGPLIRFVVASSPKAYVSLVFKSIRGIMLGHSDTGSNTLFEHVPRGAAATLVAIRQDGNQTYLATRAVTIGRKTEPGLAFHPVTTAELKDEIAQLE